MRLRFDGGFATSLAVFDWKDWLLFQRMIHPYPFRLNMFSNSICFGPFDKESKSYQILSCFLVHQIWPSSKTITAIISSVESSLKNYNHQGKIIMVFLPKMSRTMIWWIIWTLYMKFSQNEIDDVVIRMNKEELSTSTTMVFHVEFITILKEAKHNEC